MSARILSKGSEMPTTIEIVMLQLWKIYSCPIEITGTDNFIRRNRWLIRYKRRGVNSFAIFAFEILAANSPYTLKKSQIVVKIRA
jgi:hypothetical protein